MTTPPRGAVRLPSLRVHQEGCEPCLRFFSEVHPRDGGPDRQKDVGSPVNVLVYTVAQMQQDLASLRAENRLLRTPAIPQVVRAPRQAAFTTTKVPRFGGTTS